MQSEVGTGKRSEAESPEQHSETSRISIWFFIGGLVLVYGLLILGSGIRDLFVPPAHQPILAELHAGVWWGSLLTVVGGIYSHRFFPKRDR